MERPTQPGRLDLHAYRWTPFVFSIAFDGVDLTAAGLKADIRLYPDAPGDPLISLANAASPAQGMSIAVDLSAAAPVSVVEIRIGEATLEALLPFASNGTEPGKPVTLAWDLHITLSPIGKVRWLEGQFILHPGVTQ